MSPPADNQLHEKITEKLVSFERYEDMAVLNRVVSDFLVHPPLLLEQQVAQDVDACQSLAGPSPMFEVKTLYAIWKQGVR